MSHNDEQGPEGAAVFPEVPEELGVNPILLSTIHAMVFFAFSTEEAVDEEAADEALEIMDGYLSRLAGKNRDQAKEDIECVVRFLREEAGPEIDEFGPVLEMLERVQRVCAGEEE